MKATEQVQEIYRNPVVNRNFPDPTVIKAKDGFYYVYATNSDVNGKTVNIQVQRSSNLVDWDVLPDALPQKPDWATGDFWAPHVRFDQNLEKYILYYSGESTDPDIGKCLGVAVSDKPEGPFLDKGEPILCGKTFVNIDPMAFIDPESHKKFFYWGSGHESIKVRELSEDGLDFKAGSEMKEVVQPKQDDSPLTYENLIEGAWLVKRGDFYYLFYSGDNCCGDQAHYAVMVARSKNPTGPFEKYQGGPDANSVILSANSRWKAPGHNSVIKDDSGQYWMVYHAIDTEDPAAGRKMLIDKIEWKNGWPSISGGRPSEEKQLAPEINNYPN